MGNSNYGLSKLGDIIKSITGKIFIIWDYNEQKGNFNLISYHEAQKMGVFTKEYLEEKTRICSMADLVTHYTKTNKKIEIDNIYRFRI